ncbi:uncharacterized protein [Anabrus simplex]|uniref:uncharacterized protein n=1 Tax=Anabrus simplex TaxID=316456 RepID=UPI0035A291CE
MDLEVKIKEEPICFEETSNTLCCEMGKKIEIKEEPVRLEGTESTSFPSTDVKDEICVDEQTVRQLVACFKEEDKYGNVALLTGSPEGTCNRSCKILKERSELVCILPSHNECNLHIFSDSDQRAMHHSDKEYKCNFSQKSNCRRQLVEDTGVRRNCCDMESSNDDDGESDDSSSDSDPAQLLAVCDGEID